MKFKSLFAMTALLLLSACGVTLESIQVSSPTGLPKSIPGSGITYALPRTEFEVVQPVKLEVPTHGLLADTIDTCRRACDAKGDVPDEESCKYSTEPSLTFLAPELRTMAVADLDRQYQVRPSTGLFQSSNFKLENASNGVLDKMDSSETNLAYEVTSGVLKDVAKFAVMATPSMSMMTNMKNMKSGKTGAKTCHDTSLDIRQLAKVKTGTLSCSVLREVDKCMTPYIGDVSKHQTALNDLFRKAETQRIDSKLLAAIANNRREQLDAAVVKRDAAAAIYGLKPGKDKEAFYQIILPVGGPLEFAEYTSKQSMKDVIAGGLARVVSNSDNGAEMMATFSKLAKEQDRHYVVSSKLPARLKLAVDSEVVPQGDGYRYRVPVLSPTLLTVYKDSSQKDKVFGPVADRKIIAQYGPIAAMTSTFYGKGGRVMLKLWPESGALQVVEVGAEALPTSSVSDVVDELYTQRKVKNDKAEAHAASEASKDVEIDSLSRQQKLLDLKKKIKDLESDLAK